MKAHDKALINTELYLSLVSDLDIYVATSMRTKENFLSMANFCEKVFKSDKLKDYDLNQLGAALNFSIWLKQELYNAGVGSFYDICWGIGGSSSGKKSSVYDTLDSLELKVRSYNALKRAGINTVDELKKLSLEELRNIRNLGQKCFEEIVSKLADKGFVLSDESADDCNKANYKNAKPINLSERCRDEVIKRFDAMGILLKI